VHGVFATPESGEREGKEHPDPHCLGHGSFVPGRSVDSRVSMSTNDTRGISQRIRVVTRAREAKALPFHVVPPGGRYRSDSSVERRTLPGAAGHQRRNRLGVDIERGQPGLGEYRGGSEYCECVRRGHECVRRDNDLFARLDAGGQRRYVERIGTLLTRCSP